MVRDWFLRQETVRFAYGLFVAAPVSGRGSSFRPMGPLHRHSVLRCRRTGLSSSSGPPWATSTRIPLDGSPPRDLIGFVDVISGLAVGAESRLVAAGSGWYIREEAVVRVWDPVTGETRILDAGDGVRISGLKFSGDGSLWVASGTKLRRWQLDEKPPRAVEEIDFSVPHGDAVFFEDLSQDDRRVLLGAADGRLWTQDRTRTKPES